MIDLCSGCWGKDREIVATFRSEYGPRDDTMLCEACYEKERKGCATCGKLSQGFVYCGLTCARLGEDGGWIPVSERLPEPGRTVLLFEGVDIVSCGHMNDNEHWFECGVRRAFPTHWQPLPELPK